MGRYSGIYCWTDAATDDATTHDAAGCTTPTSGATSTTSTTTGVSANGTASTTVMDEINVKFE